jgi:hypothetical protein
VVGERLLDGCGALQRSVGPDQRGLAGGGGVGPASAGASVAGAEVGAVAGSGEVRPPTACSASSPDAPRASKKVDPAVTSATSSSAVSATTHGT